MDEKDNSIEITEVPIHRRGEEIKQPKHDGLFIATCATYLVILLSFVALRISVGLGMYDLLGDTWGDVFFSVVSQVLIMTIFPIIGMYIYRKKRKQEAITFAEFVNEGKKRDSGIWSFFGFKVPSWSLVAWAVLLGLLCFFFNMFVASLFSIFLNIFGHRGAAGGGAAGGMTIDTVWGLLLVLVLTAVLPGFCEEVSHRGLLLRGFAGRLGILKAIALSSLLFGLMHMNIVQFFYAAILGYIMCVAVVASRNIWVGIIIHFMNNAVGTYLFWAMHHNWFGGDFLVLLSSFAEGLLFFVFLIGLYFWIVSIIHKFAKQNFINDHKHSEVPPKLHPSKGMAAIKYYISMGENNNDITYQKDKWGFPSAKGSWFAGLGALEKTLLCGVLFLGTVVTVMTFIWGIL